MKRLKLSEAMNIVNGTGIILFTTEDCKVCVSEKEKLKNQTKIKFYETFPEELIVKRVGFMTVPICIKFIDGKQVDQLRGINGYNSYMQFANAQN